MAGRGTKSHEAGFIPEATDVLSAEQTLKLLALPAAAAKARRDAGVEALHSATFVQLPLGVAYASRDGTLIWCNEAFDRMLGLAPGEHKQKTIRDLTNAADMPANDQLLTDLWEGRRTSYSLEKRYVRRDGSDLWTHVTAVMIRTREGKPVCTVGFLEDISTRKQMEGEVERVQKALMDASRQAGMAEVATNVLHNVGNVLNSVNVSASVVAERIKASKGPRLGEVAALIEQHQADLGKFFGSDERGRKIPHYLTALATQLISERDALLKELADLRANVDHIREAVNMQQTYAKRCGVLEAVSVVDLVEDALRMNVGALTRHQVALERDYRDRTQVTVDRHKVLQILVNLIRNAKYACDESGHTDKKVIVRTEATLDGVCISVIDNGVGIAAEVMQRLFTHGFTTRKSGHGFGLHSASLAAGELGGSLKAESAGTGRGATFRLTLPLLAPGSP